MFHEPALLDEVVQLLVTDRSGVYVDCTVGGGGHAEAILTKLDAAGQLIGFDLDSEAIQTARKRLRAHKESARIIQSNFRDMGKHLEQLRLDPVTGMLLDLGISSHQIDTPQRGFSFDRPGKLDMRMDQRQDLTASKVLNTYSGKELTALFKKYGEVAQASRLSRLILHERDKAAMHTTERLRALVSQIVPFRGRAKTLAKVFQALRIVVNLELENLTEVLSAAMVYLKSGGRIVVISYHSLEDRIVKEFFRAESRRCICPPSVPVCVCGEPGRLKTLTKKPIQATQNEIRNNRRSRSARLRAAEVL